ncbi:hypothetical protein [Spirosoma profusum]|nr:hypothetical protein [Spirosoma profusum]
MTPQQFWDMPPSVFVQKVEGYYRRENRAAYYYRETYALHYNLNRGEKNPAITGEDVLTFLGEKPKRERKTKPMVWTEEEIAKAEFRANGWQWPPPGDWRQARIALHRGEPWSPVEESTIDNDSTPTNQES